MKWPGLSEGDRKVLLVLEWVAALLIGGLWLYTSYTRPTGKDEASPTTATYAVEEEPMETFPFDPNTADSTTLLRLGLAPWQVRAIYRYRAKHGRYHTPEDFKRLRGMTQELWERIGPCVRIGKEFQYMEVEPRKFPTAAPAMKTSSNNTATSVPDTTLSREKTERPVMAAADTTQRVVKYPEGTRVDVNKADTAELKKIPGIGSYRAQKIVAYREALGGFTNAEQVMEACEMPDEVLDWFQTEQPEPRVMKVNELSVQKLMRHPYISFYQAKAIVEYRKKHGSLKSLQELAFLKEFAESDIERLRAYLDFN